MNDGSYQRFTKHTLTYNRSTENQADKLILSGIVRAVCLNEDSPLFEENGGYNSIGLVLFDLLDPTIGLTEGLRAMPLDPNIRNYPLLGEVILILKGQSVNPETVNQPVQAYYYMQPIALFNNSTYNPFTPSNMNYTIKPPQGVDEENILPIKSNDGRNSLSNESQGFDPSPIGQSKFVDRGNVRPAKMFTGDIIHQGRFGNSIRFSSTKTNKTNAWSQTNLPVEYGNPILIINNGIHDNPNNIESFIPSIENPNDDKSSIYLTTTQQLPINTPNVEYNASSNPPILPNQFTKPQILINSDRIVLSAKKDSVLIQGSNNINLSSDNIGIDAKVEFSIDSNNIKIGNNNANESLMLGNKTNRLLARALTTISDLASSLQDSQNWPGGASVPDQQVIMQAVTTENIINGIIDDLKNQSNLSQVSKTV